MQQYLDLCQHILDHGEEKGDRTGTGTLSVFGYQMRFDLADGFPLVTTKKVYFKSVVQELLWFLKGSTNINDGLETKIWNNWADENGQLGPIYGFQWRNWRQYKPDAAGQYRETTIDQISQVIEMIKTNPSSRRLIVSAWNVADIEEMALPPCHAFFQFNVVNGRLDCQLYQRSADVAIGVPFNIASYALLLMMIANECDLKPGHFVHTFGDAHLYNNHLDGVREQLTRTPEPLPSVQIAKKPIFELKEADIVLENYEHQSFIKFDIAV